MSGALARGPGVDVRGRGRLVKDTSTLQSWAPERMESPVLHPSVPGFVKLGRKGMRLPVPCPGVAGTNTDRVRVHHSPGVR